MSKLSQNEREFVVDTQSAAMEVPSRAAHNVDQEIDARGLGSPLPLLRAHRALRAMPPMQLLKVITSDGHTLAEFQALAKYMTNYELVSQDERTGEFVHYLRKRR